MIALLAASLSTLGQEINISVREPRAPAELSQSLRSKCNSFEVEIDRLAISRPSGAPRIRADGKDISGDLEMAVKFLGSTAASYRFSVLCDEERSTFEILVFKAQRARDRIDYQMQRIVIGPKGKIREQEPVDVGAEDFFFR